MLLRKCPTSGKYTLKKECHDGEASILPAPAKYSPEDNYGAYRRKAKGMTNNGISVESSKD